MPGCLVAAQRQAEPRPPDNPKGHDMSETNENQDAGGRCAPALGWAGSRNCSHFTLALAAASGSICFSDAVAPSRMVTSRSCTACSSKGTAQIALVSKAAYAEHSPRNTRTTQRIGRTIGRVATNRGVQTSRTTTDRALSPRGRGQARLSPIGRTCRFVARPAWLPLL